MTISYKTNYICPYCGVQVPEPKPQDQPWSLSVKCCDCGKSFSTRFCGVVLEEVYDLDTGVKND